MDFAKNKYGIAFLVIVAVAAIHYFFFYEKCKQPDELDLAQVQLQCAMGIPNDEIKARVCTDILHERRNCILTQELVAENRDAVYKLILKMVDDCAKAELERNNFCTDKYKGMK